ncbi:pyridoxamine 5'-phosphate oxidase family protein [Rhodophyticola sp. CCM32]|uniref:pyridoxamine 5'-phosphate oxidase family protein n=1 Tax=Rhodophyticola sp. CCM32 TaxID=2916397 RepID=UPI00107F726F|nr:pyridoxamine 5'-phosphate oxidase family protein [Rhodophyticola sp. CCM32]QBX99499.1 pyridoxamine 5'-phosphate oxidase family protein [Rhodophyticola sp. CCM32]
MAKQFARIEEDHQRFIAEQHMFFTASAGPDGRVNMSPKGMESLCVLGPNRVAWLNLTGSGNETAGHLRENPRVTLMWCSFTKRPLILRLYGTARAIHQGDAEWAAMSAHFPPHRGARQVFDMDVDLVQTSCGYAVPFMEYTGERVTLQNWAETKSDAEIRAYWSERNTRTIDGKETGIPV